MGLDEAVKAVLALGPTKHGQQYLHEFYLAWLYMAGSNDPFLLSTLHPRAHHVVDFARSHSPEQVHRPDEKTKARMDELVAMFPGIASFHALDDLILGYTIGCGELLIQPHNYDEYFSPNSEHRALGALFLSWYFVAPKMPPGRNRELIAQVGERGAILEPYADFCDLFFSEVAKRVFPGDETVKRHAKESWINAGYSKKPRSKFDGEALKAIRMVYAMDVVGIHAVEHFEALEISDNVILSEIDKDDEIHKVRALASRFRTRLVSKRMEGDVNMLHNASIFSAWFAPKFLTDEFQRDIGGYDVFPWEAE